MFMLPDNAKFDDESVGLAVMRAGVVHFGHTGIASLMAQSCSEVIIGLGSCQESGTFENPFNFDERLKQWQNVFGKRIKFIQLKDIGLTEYTTEWCQYVLEKIHGLGMPAPSHYFSGSYSDSLWYKEMFEDNLIIIERDNNPIPSGTELRTMIQLRDDGWKKWVPPVNHQFIEENYPEHLRIKQR